MTDIKLLRLSAICACLWPTAGRVVADDPAPKPATDRLPIVATQLTLRLAPVEGRATVIAIADDTLTVVTAAHFLTAEGVGKAIVIEQHKGHLIGRVAAIARNPNFRPIKSRNSAAISTEGTVGVDSALAVIKVDLRDEAERLAFSKIKAADLTTRRIPGSSGQVIPVRIVDQDGNEHVVRAGNHLNPRCLAWGRQNYEARPGDSGAGVFIIRKLPEGEPMPILIGCVSQTDDRGAIASLVHRDEAWIEDALARLPSKP